MKNIRLISRLDIKGPNVVKPVQTEALHVIDPPHSLAVKYYNEGIDELIYLDIVASLYGRKLDYQLLSEVSEQIFIPLTAGGGIKSLSDIKKTLRSGADKIALNTYAVYHPEFITAAAEEFGSQCIVVSIEAKRKDDNLWEVYTDGGREPSGKNAITWAKEAIERGAGEILITSIDNDGTKRGYDLDLIKEITSFSPIPVISHGGASNPQSIFEAIHKGHTDAVCASSIFHYNLYSIKEIKKFLISKKIPIRPFI